MNYVGFSRVQGGRSGADDGENWSMTPAERRLLVELARMTASFMHEYVVRQFPRDDVDTRMRMESERLGFLADDVDFGESRADARIADMEGRYGKK